MTKEEKGKEALRLLGSVKNRAVEIAYHVAQYEPYIRSDYEGSSSGLWPQ
jgi:hypothetical protein